MVLTASEDELRERRRARQRGRYFKEIMPLIQRHTMKILLKRRLTPSEVH